MQKTVSTNALLFGLLAVAYDRPAHRDNSHPNDAQEPLKSLGEIAKEAKKNKVVRAKTGITEETLYSHKGPLPTLDLEGPETIKISSRPSATTRASTQIRPRIWSTTGTGSTTPCWP